MEDEIQEEEQGGEEIKQPPKKGKKKPIMLIGIILVQVVIAYILWVAIIKPKFFAEPENAQQEMVQDEVKEEHHEFGKIYTIEKITVNIQEDRKNRFILTGFGIEVSDEKTAATLDARITQVRDIIIRILRKSDIEDLQDVDYEDSLLVMIKDKLNEILPEEQEVWNVFFSDFTIQ